jgi:hypothetical protein
MLPGPASTVTLCGHPEAVNGHCGTGGCGARWEPEQWASYGRQVIRRRHMQEAG